MHEDQQRVLHTFDHLVFLVAEMVDVDLEQLLDELVTAVVQLVLTRLYHLEAS
ncbi:MAG: hypothetical protein ACMG6E_02995 [Candidatus Roizmanbacteria bacterium]